VARQYLTNFDLRDAFVEAVRSEMPKLITEALREHLSAQPRVGGAENQTDTFMSRRAAASRLSVSVQTVAKLIANGDLPITRIGRRVLVSELDVQSLVNKRRVNRLGEHS